MCKSDMSLFVQNRQDFCDFDERVCDCVGLRRSANPTRFLGGTMEGAAVVVLQHRFAAFLGIMWDVLARIEISGDKAKFY